MVDERITDGIRIAQLLASEVDGREDGGLDRLAVTNADPDVEPTADGAHAFDVTRGGSLLAGAFVHPDRVSLTVTDGRDVALETAATVGLTVESNTGESNTDRSSTGGPCEDGPTVDRSNDGDPTSTRLSVESGAAVKPATDVLAAASRAVDADTESEYGG